MYPCLFSHFAAKEISSCQRVSPSGLVPLYLKLAVREESLFIIDTTLNFDMDAVEQVNAPSQTIDWSRQCLVSLMLACQV